MKAEGRAPVRSLCDCKKNIARSNGGTKCLLDTY